jgi:hypothetical protein
MINLSSRMFGNLWDIFGYHNDWEELPAFITQQPRMLEILEFPENEELFTQITMVPPAVSPSLADP